MLDTRLHGRDEQSGTTGSVVTSNNRQLLGTDQFTWLGNRLDSSSAKWKILTQQVMFAPLKVLGQAVNGDQWDGYPAERTRVMNHIINNNIKNVVVITGDIHSSWANDIPTSTYNSSTGSGSAGVEFVTPSVTSPGLNLPGGASAVQLANSHIKYADLSKHGFFILDLNNTKTQCDWFYVNTIDQSSTAFSHGKSMYVNNQERFLRSTNSVSMPRSSIYGIMAPLCPRIITNTTTNLNEISKSKLLNVFPNPAENQLVLSFLNNETLSGSIIIYNQIGQKVYERTFTNSDMYNSQLILNINTLNSGLYNGSVNVGGSSTFFKFIKN
jgi:alkaline phosphatase D